MPISRWKKFLSAITAFCLVVTMTPAVALGAVSDLCVCGASPFNSHIDMVGHIGTSLKSYNSDTGAVGSGSINGPKRLSDITTAGTYFLTEDVTLQPYDNRYGNWNVPSGETVLWTDGYDINVDYSSARSMQDLQIAGIYVPSGATLTISAAGPNASVSNQSKITGNVHPQSTGNTSPEFGGICVSNGGVLNVYGIDISMTGADTSGIIVRAGGTVNIYAGAYSSGKTLSDGTLIPTSISNNTKYGIQNWGGTVNIYGGSIKNNAQYGVYVQDYVIFGGSASRTDGVLNMYSGTIEGNKSGGVQLAEFYEGQSVSFNLYGGSITGNGTNSGVGGGVNIDSNQAIMTLRGEGVDSRIAGQRGVSLDPIEISGNKAGKGPNVYVNTDSADDPRITVVPGNDPMLGVANKIGVATKGTEENTVGETMITTGTPDSAGIFTSDSTDYVVTTDSAASKVALFKKSGQSDAPVAVKDSVSVEYTGKELSASVVDNGTTVAGTWSWKDGTAPKNVADSRSYTAVFIPTDTVRYRAVEKTVPVTITPKQLEYGFTSLPKGFYGDKPEPAKVTLLDSPIAGDEVPITVTYEGAKGTTYGPSPDVPTNAGDYTVSASTSNPNYKLFITYTPQFNIGPATREAPNVSATGETIQGKGDGKINGLTTDMEISADGGSTYNAVTDSDITKNYAVGTYLVRDKENPNYRNNPAKQVTVNASTNKLKVTVPADQQGYTLTANDAELVWHGSTTLKYALKPGYTETDAFKVLLNGTTDITQAAKSAAGYSLSNVESDSTVEVQGVVDNTAPEVELSLSNASWKQFLNAVSFGLFFRNDVQNPRASVKASDAGSGIAQASVLVSDVSLDTEDKVRAATGWQSLTLNDKGEVSFDIGGLGKRYLYVRVSDKAGNVKVVNPDKGVVVYTDSAAVTSALVYEKDSEAPAVAQVNLNGNTVREIRLSNDVINDVIEASKYTVNAATGTISFQQAYLDALAEGTYTVHVSYNPQGETYQEYLGDPSGSNINGAPPVDTTFTLTVAKQHSRVENVSDIGKVYDGAPVSAPTFNTNNTAGPRTVEYKVRDTADTFYTQTAPKDAGDYTVRVTVGEDANGHYQAGSATSDFTISKRPVTVAGAKVAETKVYDGTVSAELVDAGALEGAIAASEGVIAGDDVQIVAGTASYAEKSAGTDKRVSFTGFGIMGDDVRNYELSAQPADTTADISKRTLSVNVKVADRQYDGTNVASFDGEPSLTGLVDGDDVSLAYSGTPTFDQSTVGENIAVNLPPFTISGTDAANYDLAQPAGVTASILAYVPKAGADYTVNSNDWINTDFVVSAKPGFQVSLTGAEGSWAGELRAANETADGELSFYVKNTTTGALSNQVTERYRIDKTAPSATATLAGAGGSWTQLVNSVSFDRFFNSARTLDVRAQDALSGVAKVEHHVAERQLSVFELAAVPDGEWSEVASGTAVLEPQDGKRFVTYVRVTDRADNRAYLSTDGGTWDTSAPKIEGAENNKTYYTTRSVSVADANLASVTLNGQDVTAQAKGFALEGNREVSYEIEATDKAGNVTKVAVSMKKIADVSKGTEDINENNVTPDDKANIEDAKKELENIDTTGATEAEKQNIQDRIAALDVLLEKIAQQEKAQAAKTQQRTDSVSTTTSTTTTVSSSADKTSEAPASGDSNQALVLLALALVLLSGATVVVFACRKRNKAYCLSVNRVVTRRRRSETRRLK